MPSLRLRRICRPLSYLGDSTWAAVAAFALRRPQASQSMLTSLARESTGRVGTAQEARAAARLLDGLVLVLLHSAQNYPRAAQAHMLGAASELCDALGTACTPVMIALTALRPACAPPSTATEGVIHPNTMAGQ